MKKIKYIVLSSALLATTACTNLDEKVFNQIPADGFGSTPDQLAALLGPAYSNLRGYSWNIHNAEVTSDAMMVPTRGGDWYDGGNWLAYSRHTWTPTHGPINDMWGWMYEGGIGRINQLMATVKGNAAAESELRAVRAFYYLMLVDYFGNVPVITETLTDASTKSRAEVAKFIESELKAALPNLSESAGGSYYGRVNKWAAQMMLAKLYLNWTVFTGEAARNAEVVAACDAVIKSGKYSLEANFFDNFKVANEGSKENIWALPFDRFQAGGMNIQMRTLHYQSQNTFGLAAAPWNGFCTLTDFYNSFENSDVRRNMFLAGPQFSADGKRLNDDKGNPLSFDVEFKKDQMTADDPEFQRAGARFQKYEIQKNNSSTDQDNDMVIFRLGDAMLMRAEANARLGKTADALPDVNPLRARAGVAAWTAADVTLDNILAERGRETAEESWRRQDLIRFGKFETASKFFVGKDPKYRLFPIPQPRLDANPKLKQNPGY